MDAVQRDVTWKAASLTRREKAGEDPSGESELEVRRKDLSEGTASCFKQSWRWFGLRMMR